MESGMLSTVPFVRGSLGFTARLLVIWSMGAMIGKDAVAPSTLEAQAMQDIRVHVTVEVDHVANGLAIRKPVPIQVVKDRRKQWHAECDSPRFETTAFETMEEAIVAGAKQAHAELQMAVEDRPMIVGRITPDDVPVGRF